MMSSIKAVVGWVAGNPVRAMAVVSAILAAFAPILPTAVISGISGVIAAILGVGVHRAVTPVTRSNTKIEAAANVAATETVKALGPPNIGPIGKITPTAQIVVDAVILKTVDSVTKS